MEGAKGLTGMLGEIIYREHLKEIEVPIVRESTSDYDFLIGADSKRVDVKTKGASYRPRGDWDVSIPMGADGPLFACSRRTRTSGVYRPTLDKHLDAFAFVRIETPKRNTAESPRPAHSAIHVSVPTQSPFASACHGQRAHLHLELELRGLARQRREAVALLPLDKQPRAVACDRLRLAAALCVLRFECRGYHREVTRKHCVDCVSSSLLDC